MIKQKRCWMNCGILLAGIIFSFILHKNYLFAKTDTTPPKISINVNTETPTNQPIKAVINVTDESDILVVSWDSKRRTKAYFKDKGKPLSLNKNGKASVNIKNNGDYTFFAKDTTGNVTTKKITISNLDLTPPTLNSVYKVIEQKATVTVNGYDKDSGIRVVKYLKGTFDAEDSNWEETGNDVPDLESFQVNAAGDYSIYIEDNAGNKTVQVLHIIMEMRAVWISYLEFEQSKEYTYDEFKKYIDTVFDNCIKMNMNTVIVQVRPLADAMYPSSYFPWSKYASGTEGVNPGYDPLKYMVKAAHNRNLAIHAWINPYRVSLNGTNIKTLSNNNQAKIWANDPKTSRYVLAHDGKLYYNPAIKEVQNLIIRGVKEIVKKYDVDGIHFDDYFYPSLGSKYKTNFDSIEYQQYVSDCKKAGKTEKSIEVWRRENVSNMVKRVYAAIKKLDKNCVFGISPAGSISNLSSNSNYYVDIKKWLSSSDYLDYICPQVYWSFEHPVAPYKTVVDEWVKIKTSKTINLYIGLAAYRAGDSASKAKSYNDISWSKSNTILKQQVQYGRKIPSIDGYIFFRYDSMLQSKTKKEIDNLMSLFR